MPNEGNGGSEASVRRNADRSQAQTTMERPYTEGDLKGLKRAALVALINRQLNKWPLPRGKLSKVNMPELRAKLLDPALGFTTTNTPLPGAPHNTAPVVATQPGDAEVDLNSNPGQPMDVESNAAEGRGTSHELMKEIQLLIDDLRPMNAINTFQRVKVHAIDSESCEEGEWRANAHEIISALQNSNGRLSGLGQIGVPAPFNPSYTEYFVQMVTTEPIETLINSGNEPKEPEIELGSPIGSTPIPAPAPVASASGTARSTPTELELNWLKNTIRKRPDYTTFEANHNKILQNIDRVKYWRFAFAVDKQLHKSSYPSEISSSKVSKAAIHAALQMQTTALAEAIQMVRIIDLYTTEGANFSAEVAVEIRKSDQEDPKATVLKAFLLNWEKTHPIEL
ncbi:hypothetical protein DFH07DRAFT_771907 [Mycena maculata]|uniref:Uncharacterized protein n=1 Tax=Mycena maculata TaxID=230809 RepID=A0AAD7NGP3_9AGAR|nr:hypothetical protein DFH07DRAFT_771907 [Mycena maculata]